MEILESILIKGNSYSKEEIEAYGCNFIKKTNVMFYRKDDLLYAFNSICDNKSDKYKLLSVIPD